MQDTRIGMRVLKSQMFLSFFSGFGVTAIAMALHIVPRLGAI